MFFGLVAFGFIVAFSPVEVSAQDAGVPSSGANGQGTIVETAVAAGTFQTLVAAVQAAGLVETLNGPGPFTVFAPTDEAFSALPKGTIATLLEPDNRDQLVAILTYHVVAGRVSSGDALGLSSAATIAGPSIAITLTEGGANINDARLIQTDIAASNGVIHVIDRVLLPPTPADNAVAMKPAVDAHGAARSLLTNAINRGVPAFNSGNHGQCAAIYMEALQSVANMPGLTMSAAMQNEVKGTLQACPRMSSMTDRSWKLRGQIDRLMMAL